MDEQELDLAGKIRVFVRRNMLFVILVFTGLVLCAAGIFQFASSKASTNGVQFITGTPEARTQSQDITVDIEGEVQKPGVYQLKDGVRLQEVIDKAGGYTSNSDREYISKNINLAQKITDGSKIYIPAQGEINTDKSVLGTGATSTEVISQNIPAESTNLININTADLNTLDSLPKVGPVTAQKIIDNRPYGTIEDLVNKKVVGQKAFDGLKERIVAQ